MPSKKNEFSHPDVSIILTYLAYYSNGISLDEFYTCLQSLKSNNVGYQLSEYKRWRSLLNEEQLEDLLAHNAKEIKVDSSSQVRNLYSIFRKNRYCVAFWLQKCVLPQGMTQFNYSITSSSWDYSNVDTSIGFSGTKDIHRLFPTYINLKRSHEGTDGKMLDMLMENTLEVMEIRESDLPQWSRFLNVVLELESEDEGISCVIDAGALLVGKELKEIVKWIAKHENFPSKKFRGISFCDHNIWKVYDLNTH